jgi:glutamine amidotransferase
MIAILDYRMGNLRSVQKAIESFGEAATVIDQPEQIDSAAKLILPGVGAFADAMTHLRDFGFVDPIRRYVESGKPMLGICLGLQLLFDASEEDGEHEGLGIVGGRCVKFAPTDPTIRVPHMGWNRIDVPQPGNPLLADLPDDPHVYFVHSFYAKPTDPTVVAAWAEYDGRFCASVWQDNIWATQFHPEKSQRVGAKILQNFVEI